jgi:hypothetical protein
MGTKNESRAPYVDDNGVLEVGPVLGYFFQNRSLQTDPERVGQARFLRVSALQVLQQALAKACDHGSADWARQRLVLARLFVGLFLL